MQRGRMILITGGILLVVTIILLFVFLFDFDKSKETSTNVDYEIIYIENMPCVHMKYHSAMLQIGREALTCDWSKWRN